MFLLLVCAAGLSAQTLTCTAPTFLDGSGSFSNPAVTIPSTTSGDMILVTLQVDNSTVNLGVTDNKSGGSNTYVEDFHGTQPKQLNLWSTIDAGGGVTSVTVQTGGFAHGSIGITTCHSTTGWPASHFDKAHDNTNASAITGVLITSGATATTTQAVELWYGVFVSTATLTSPSWVAGTSWTSLGNLAALHYLETQSVSATGAATATATPSWTGGGGPDFVGLVGTYKPNAAAATASLLAGPRTISGPTTIQ